MGNRKLIIKLPVTYEELGFEPIPLTPELLEEDGWERQGNILCLKSNPRLGWKADSQTFIVGYTELPTPIRYYHEVLNIIKALHIKID